MRVVVVGGAGYIGAHVTRLLLDRGDDVVVVDNLSTGDAARVEGAELHLLTVTSGDDAALAEVLGGSDAVVHFAARKSVEESVHDPVAYYRDNVVGVTTVLAAMRDAGVGGLVFSSSAAVYGEASGVVSESADLRPINPYGRSKVVGEWAVSDAAAAYRIRALSLRYFNVAGAADPSLRDHGARNLVPIAVEHARQGRPVSVFGDGYDTPDGSCVRDYVHVSDVADAHLAALDHVVAAPAGYDDVLNVGTGVGSSVLEVLTTLGEVSGQAVDYEIGPPRDGDPAAVIGAVGKIEAVLGWRASRDLRAIVGSASETRNRG